MMYGNPAMPKTKRQENVQPGREPKRRKIEDTVLPGQLNAAMASAVNREAEYLLGAVMDEPMLTDKGVVTKLRELREQSQAIVRPPGFVDPLARAGTGRELTHAAIKRGIKQIETGEGMANPTVGLVGKWTESGYASGAVSKADRRDLQLLGQLSQLLISSVTATEEIEAMAINGRIVVSANEQSTVHELCALDLAATLTAAKSTKLLYLDRDYGNYDPRRGRKIADVAAALALAAGVDPDTVTDPAVVNGIKRLVKLEGDCGVLHSQSKTVNAILQTLSETVVGNRPVINGGTPEAVAAMIHDDQYAGRIIVVDAWNVLSRSAMTVVSHAEQNLAYTAVLSGFTGTVAIAGGKRPCSVCWMTMCLARASGLDVRFNPHAGGFWDGTTYRGIWRVAVALKFTDEDYLSEVLYDLCQGDEGLVQHVTNLAADAPSSKPIKLFQSIKHRQHATGTSSPSQSQEYPSAPPSPIAVPELAVEPESAQQPASKDSMELEKRVSVTEEPKSFGGDAGDDVLIAKLAPKVLTVELDENGALLTVFAQGVKIVRGSGQPSPAEPLRTYGLDVGDGFEVGSQIWRIVTV